MPPPFCHACAIQNKNIYIFQKVIKGDRESCSYYKGIKFMVHTAELW